MVIRREREDEAAAVRTVTAAAFGPGNVEAGLVAALRASPAWLPALSLVAVEGEEVVGHVACTRATVGGAPALGLGPLSVAPARQRRGIGSALVHAVLGAAEALDEPVVCLLGAPAYYARFGFVPARGLGIEPPEPAWGDHFQARALSARGRLRGRFRFAEPFERL